MENVVLTLMLLATLAGIFALITNPSGVENDAWLRRNAKKLGILKRNINPASVDLCLGQHIIEYRNGLTHEHFLDEGEEFTFLPGSFYLAHSEEYTRCPETHAWMLALKSSMGRKGLDHFHAGWGDPGFEGQVTFEFQAVKPVVLRQGQPVVQLIYFRMANPPRRSYKKTGRYNGQLGAQPAL